jgi:hypothetical protein
LRLAQTIAVATKTDLTETIRLTCIACGVSAWAKPGAVLFCDCPKTIAPGESEDPMFTDAELEEHVTNRPTKASGSYLGCLTSKRSSGQG